MKKQKKEEMHIHRDCVHCTPFEGGFLNWEGKPILGDCCILPHKVILNEKTSCKQWKQKNIC